MKYREWTITNWCPSIPIRNHDYQGVHPEYDGPGDTRVVTGMSIEDVKNQIDEMEDEN